MSLVWMLEGPKAGKFVTVTAQEANELIKDGKAQIARTGVTHLKKPNYATREIVAEQPDTEPAPQPEEAPKPKRRKKKAAA